MSLPVKIGSRPAGATLTWSNQQISMIRRSCAADANEIEFDHFISLCQHLQLNPMARQAYCIVYNKDKPDRRKTAFIIAIDGYRAVAQRSGNYMPGDTTWDVSAGKSETNPVGILSATVTVKKYIHGGWHTFSGTCFWDEYAPLKDEWTDGKRTGKKILSGKWAEMPRHMLAKCAEALALRKGWPELFSGTHTQEEWDRESIDVEFRDVTPSDAVRLAEKEKIASAVNAKIGGPGILFLMTDEVVNVPYGQIHDKISEFFSRSTPLEIVHFGHRNTDGLRLFFAHDTAACLDLKKKIESAQAALDKEAERAELREAS